MSSAYDGLPDELNPLKRKGATAPAAPPSPAGGGGGAYDGLPQEMLPQQPVTAVDPNTEMSLGNIGSTALNGALMGWGAEARGALGSLFGGDYRQIRDAEERRLEAFRKANPGTALVSDLAGGVVGGIPLMLAAPPAALARLGPMGARLAAMAGGGAIEGAISGAGNAKEGERLGGAATGAAVGAVAAPVIGTAMGAAARGGRAATEFFSGRYGGDPAKRATRELADLVAKNGGADALEGRLAQTAATQARQATPHTTTGMLGQPQAAPTPMMQETLAERLGSPMVKRVDDLANMEGTTRGAVQDLLTHRADEQVQVMNGAIESIFGSRPNAFAQGQMLRQNRHQQTERAVNDMLAQFQTGPQHLDQITELFRRTPRNFLERAAREARVEGDDLHRVFIPDPNDPSGVQMVEHAMPTLRNLHNLFKTARRAGSERGPDGSFTSDAIVAQRAQQNIREVMNSIMGEDNFAAVNRAWSDPTRNLEALDLGRKAATMDRPEALREQISRYVQNDDDRDAFLAGVADSLRERVRTNADVGRSPNLAAKLWQPRERENIRETLSVLYPDRADRDAAFRRLDDTMRSLEAAHVTRGTVQGSLTAPRQAGKDQLQGNALQSVAQGGVLGGMGAALGGVLTQSPVGGVVGFGLGSALGAVERGALHAQRQKINDAMGRQLLATAPQEQQLVLDRIIKRLRDQEARNRGWAPGLIPGMGMGGAVGGINAREDER